MHFGLVILIVAVAYEYVCCPRGDAQLAPAQTRVVMAVRIQACCSEVSA